MSNPLDILKDALGGPAVEYAEKQLKQMEKYIVLAVEIELLQQGLDALNAETIKRIAKKALKWAKEHGMPTVAKVRKDLGY